MNTQGVFGGVMVSKLGSETYTSEFESYWVPLSYGHVPHLTKKLSKLLFKWTNSSISENSILHKLFFLYSKSWTVLFDRTLSGATTPGESGPGSDGNEGIFHIRLSSDITGA